MSDTKILLLLAALLAAASAGCLGLERSYPQKRYFLIDATRGGDPLPAQGERPLLLIRRLDVSPGWVDPNLVYRRLDGSWESDFYNRFFVPPAAMLTGEVREWLRSSGLFAHVVEPGSQAEPDLILEGSITALYGDFAAPSLPQAVMEMQFLLVDPADGYRVRFEGDYRSSFPAEAAEPEALVEAWDQALADLLARLEGDLARVCGEG